MSRTRYFLGALVLALSLTTPLAAHSSVPHGPPPAQPPGLSCDHEKCIFGPPSGVVHDGFKFSHSTSEDPGSVGWWEHVTYAPPGTVVRVRLCNGSIPFSTEDCGPAAEAVVRQPPSIPDIIESMFERFGASESTQDFAVQVARCESGLNPRATNGQYLGLFQMGSYHYWRFDGRPWSDPYVNSKAAASLWAEQGWRPWSCA